MAVTPKHWTHTHAGEYGVVTRIVPTTLMEVRILTGKYKGEILLTSQAAWVSA